MAADADVFQDEEKWSDEEKRNLIEQLASLCDDNTCTDEKCTFVSRFTNFFYFVVRLCAFCES